MPQWMLFVISALVGGLLLLILLAWLAKRILLGVLRGLTGAGNTTPVRIKAIPKPPDQPWRQAEAVQKARAFFESKQFEWVADFELTPMDDVYASVLVDRDGYGVVVYDHPQAGTWVDVIAQYSERGGLCVSSVPSGGALDPPPFSHKYYLKGGRPEQLWTVFQEKVKAVPSSARMRLTPENVVAEFENAYADEIDWRNAQGGASADEVRRVDKDRPIPEDRPLADDQQVQAAVSVIRRQADAALLEGLRHRFRAQSRANETDETLVFVHEKLDESSLAEFITPHLNDEALEATGMPEACRNLSALEAFAKLQTLLPEPARFRRVGELDFPLATHVYARPAGQVPANLFPHRAAK